MITENDQFHPNTRSLQSKNLFLRVMSLGATVLELRYRGRPVVLSYPAPDDYLRHTAYLGAIVGRVANRIGDGSFTLGGRRYELSKNEGKNTLHDGRDSWDRRLWDSRVEADSLVYTLCSPDGDNGFPGRLRAELRYTLYDDALRIDFYGESDADTLFAPTTHLYFNLCGAGSVLDTRVRIDADGYLEVDDALIPTGRILPTAGDFDFSASRPIGRHFDHCFVLSGAPALEAVAGDLRMRVETDFPALHFYTGEFLPPPHTPGEGFAVEPEFFPDAIHHPSFDAPILRAGECFHRHVVYTFSEDSEN